MMFHFPAGREYWGASGSNLGLGAYGLFLIRLFRSSMNEDDVENILDVFKILAFASLGLLRSKSSEITDSMMLTRSRLS